MLLRFSNTDWHVTGLGAGVAVFFSTLMLCYLWYYQQPSLDALTKKPVVISSIKTVNWVRKSASGNSSPALEYLEVLGKSDDSPKQTRYLLSKSPTEILPALREHGGACVLWFDPKQANEIFQIEVGGSNILKYDEIYALKAQGWQSWWNISISVFVLGSIVLLFYIVHLKSPRNG